MIYKRQKVRGVRIGAGQVVNAPVAPFTLRTVEGDGTSGVKPNSPVIRYAGVKATPVSMKTFNGSAYLRSHYPVELASTTMARVVPDRPDVFHDREVRPLMWDVSETTFIELRGEFESCPLVMIEGVLDAKDSSQSKSVPSMRPITYPNGFLGVSGSKERGSTTIYPDAYVLLQDAYFSGEVIFHNTVQDRNTPFRWPVYFSPTLSRVPLFRNGQFTHAPISSPALINEYIAAWAHSNIRPPVIVSTDPQDSLGRDFSQPMAWRVLQLDPACAYPCLAIIVPESKGHHDTVLHSISELGGTDVVLRSLRQSVWATREIACLDNPDWTRYPDFEMVSAEPDDASGITLMFESSGPKGRAPFALTVSTKYAVLSANNWSISLDQKSHSFAHNPHVFVGPIPDAFTPAAGTSFDFCAGAKSNGIIKFASYSMKEVVDGIVNQALLSAHDLALLTPDNEAPGLWVLESATAEPPTKG